MIFDIKHRNGSKCFLQKIFLKKRFKPTKTFPRKCLRWALCFLKKFCPFCFCLFEYQVCISEGVVSKSGIGPKEFYLKKGEQQQRCI